MISSTPFFGASRPIVKLALVVSLTAALSGVHADSNAAPQGTGKQGSATKTAVKTGPAKANAVKPAVHVKSTAKKSSVRPASNIAASSGRPRVLEFSAVWCAPCKIFAPIFHKVSADFASKADFETYDLDDVVKGQKLALKYGVDAVPAIVILDAQGKVVYSHAGTMSEQALTQEITQVIGR